MGPLGGANLCYGCRETPSYTLHCEIPDNRLPPPSFRWHSFCLTRRNAGLITWVIDGVNATRTRELKFQKQNFSSVEKRRRRSLDETIQKYKDDYHNTKYSPRNIKYRKYYNIKYKTQTWVINVSGYIDFSFQFYCVCVVHWSHRHCVATNIRVCARFSSPETSAIALKL